jgi:lipopolysaccharide cholinephosphotransferase
VYNEHHLTPEELRAVQLIELELLAEVDRICEKRGVRYSVVGGTLLGAVRHKGFIPWDDDVDVGFLRPEYEKFRECLEDELDYERFYFQDHRNTPGYRWGYGKLRRRGTSFVRLGQEHMPYEQGVFIDIFPYDSVPERYIPRLFFSVKCFLYRKAFWSPVGRVSGRNPVKRFLYRQLYRIPEARLYKKFDNFAAGRGWRQTGWVRILTFPTPNRAFGYKREWLEQTAPVVFEGREFSGVKDYDEYLTFKYGRYMKIPPVGQRRTHPVSLLRLPEPYYCSAKAGEITNSL